MIYRFIQRYSSEFSVQKMSKTLGISRSSYYEWLNRKPGKWAKENQQILESVKTIHAASQKIYGSPKITEELREQGYSCSRQRVARIMRKHGIYSKIKKKFKVTTNSKHKYPASPNLLNQDFSAKHPNEKWVSDITYIRTKEGWLYLTIILDLFNREIVGWSMSNRMKAETATVPALVYAWKRKNPGPGLIFHSDQGIQYASSEFRKYIKRYGMKQSMSCKGNCYDNAVAESFFHLLKTEHVYFERYQNHQEAKRSIFWYVEIFYNRKRKHSALGYKTPIEVLNIQKAA